LLTSSIEEGQTFDLTVQSSSLGVVRARTTSLYRGSVYVENPESLEVVSTVARFPVEVTLGSNGAAYILRFFVEYEYLAGGTWQTERMEVPWQVRGGSATEPAQLIYPILLARGQNAPISPSGSDGGTFSGDAYRYVITHIKNKYTTGGLRFKNAVFSLTQTDYPLYAYYSTVNAFPGSGSLRLDKPDYTNIEGGLGVFASERLDEYLMALSPSLGS
jgi:hypothetical protein